MDLVEIAAGIAACNGLAHLQAALVRHEEVQLLSPALEFDGNGEEAVLPFGAVLRLRKSHPE